MNELIHDIRRCSPSSIIAVEKATVLITEIMNRHPDRYIGLLKYNLVRKEATILGGFFFNIYPNKDKLEIWSFVKNVNIPFSTLRELFLSVNYRFMSSRIKSSCFGDKDTVINWYDTELNLDNNMIESYETDIEHYTKYYFEHRGITSMEQVYNKIKIFLFHQKVTRQEYLLFKPSIVNCIIEYCTIEKETSMSILKEYVESFLLTVMCKILLDSKVEWAYNKTKRLDITTYTQFYLMLNKEMKINE